MLEGFAFAGFRSFFNELEPGGPMSKVHLVIGQNNTGKSNVLRFASDYLTQLKGSEPFVLPVGLDQPRGAGASVDFRISLAGTLPETFGQSVEDLIPHQQYKHLGREALLEVLASPLLRLSGDDRIWIPCQLSGQRSIETRLEVIPEIGDQVVSGVTLDEQHGTGLRFLRDSVGGTNNQVLQWVLNVMAPWAGIRDVVTIQALRSITAEPPGDYPTDHSGRGLIKRLAQLESPGMSHLEDRARFNEINEFVSIVLEDPTARITIPADADVVHVVSHGIELPLENLGTGLHEVIILAAAATILEDHLVCIEEPEVHLHPVLQRRLLSYLATHTTNQYLIATHSAHMLDANLASVSHVTMENSRSSVKPATAVSALARISADLGYRPSDLLQSNAVVWVEGPSDRIYLEHWLTLEDPDLTEGVHYSLMFYGGSLLNHLTASDQEVKEFIDLRRLNHNLAIVIDSDRKVAGQKMNATKLRVKREFDSAEVTGFPWITHGYTIENYVPWEVLREAAAKVNPSRDFKWRGSRLENPLPNPKGKTSFDKAGIAREVVSNWPVAARLTDDLDAQIGRLAQFIRAANS